MEKFHTITCAIWLVVLSAGSTSAEPTKQEFVDYVLSTASFLEQCAARNVIATNNVQNEVLEMAKSLGLFEGDYWTPLQQGADGVVYDMLRQKWIRMELGAEACELTLSEQKKIRTSLARYF
jgi:hypothetical protein